MTGWSSRSFYTWENRTSFLEVLCVDLSDHSSQASDEIATGYVLDEINIQSANLEQTELLSMIRMTGQGKGNSGKGSSEPPRDTPHSRLFSGCPVWRVLHVPVKNEHVYMVGVISVSAVGSRAESSSLSLENQNRRKCF